MASIVFQLHVVFACFEVISLDIVFSCFFLLQVSKWLLFS